MKYLLLFSLLVWHIPAIAQSHGPEICNNGSDDDGDGLIDCEDGDCTSSPPCILQRTEGIINGVPFNCNNGIDDDGDGLIDCLDLGCPSCNIRDLQ